MRSVQAADASSALRDKAPSAFVQQLRTRLEDDREPVESSSKYTAFWLQCGLPVSSQYRVDVFGVGWNDLKITDPSPAHPDGKFICQTCKLEHAQLHPHGIQRSYYNEGQYYSGIADVAHLRRHAAIINMQKRCLDSQPAQARAWPLYMTQVFNNFADSCAWLGNPCAMQVIVDGYVHMLRDFQVRNAGIAEMFTRQEAFLVEKSESDYDVDGYHYDSDESLPSVAEEEYWYNFEETDRSLERLQRFQARLAPDKCPACWGYHPSAWCCCHEVHEHAELAERPSAITPDTKLGTCPRKLCRIAMQKTNEHDWAYSFEAECLLYPLPTAETRCPLTPIHQNLCQGLVGDGLPALLPGQPSVDKPEAVLASLDRLGDDIGARPTFAELFCKADDELELLKRVKPYMYVGTVSGVRSAFCGSRATESQSTCAACQHLHTKLQSIKH